MVFMPGASAGDESFCSHDLVLPPGLAPPPGLMLSHDESGETQGSDDSYPDSTKQRVFQCDDETETFAPPPGLERGEEHIVEQPVVAAETIKVTINGIPDKLLSDAVVEAMLDQAACSVSLVSFNIIRSKQSGHVKAIFADKLGAQQCVKHFHGRQWGPSGAPVRATMQHTSAQSPQAKESCSVRKKFAGLGPSVMPSQHCQPGVVWAPAVGRYDPSIWKRQAKALSASAPAFEPSVNRSPGSPAFVPLFEFKGGPTPDAKQRTTNSDTSTEMGESGSEDESRSPSKLFQRPVSRLD